MRLNIIAATKIVLRKSELQENPFLDEVLIDLQLDEKMDKEAFFDKDGVINAEGSKMFTDVCIQGLVANIHFANAKDFQKDSDHMRYIIAELEKSFMEVPEAIGTKTGKIIKF